VDLPFPVALRKTKHHCHLPNALLRARRECTRRCDATRKHHELPPPHARPQGQLRDRSGSNEARKENDVRHGFVDKLPSRHVHSYLKRFDLPGDFQCCRIFDRNSCARSLRGLPKKSAVGASSTISPLSMKITRLATLRAKPISWVTTIMVMPSLARVTMTSSTSLIISGSSAEVGSSNSIAIGSIAKARAMATRCCWPPDNWPGNLLACALNPTRSRSFMPFSAAVFGLRPRTLICASDRFCMTER